jgi:hypothetical protein
LRYRALGALSSVINLPVAFAVAGPVMIGAAICILMIGFLAELKVHHHLKGAQPHPVVEAIGKLSPDVADKIVKISSLSNGSSFWINGSQLIAVAFNRCGVSHVLHHCISKSFFDFLQRQHHDVILPDSRELVSIAGIMKHNLQQRSHGSGARIFYKSNFS